MNFTITGDMLMIQTGFNLNLGYMIDGVLDMWYFISTPRRKEAGRLIARPLSSSYLCRNPAGHPYGDLSFHLGHGDCLAPCDFS